MEEGGGDLRGRGRPCLRLRGMVVRRGTALWIWMCWRMLSVRGACLLRLLRTGLDPSTTRPPDRAHDIPVSQLVRFPEKDRKGELE